MNSIFLSIISFALFTPTDTIKQIDEVVVVSQRDTDPLKHQAISYSSINATEAERHNTDNIRQASNYTPNVYMPEYGSTGTPAIYIRGIGSRIGTPAVGMYVDDIPMIEKSTMDFDLTAIERIDVMRGPQGTLYGAGAMGGIIGICTKSPWQILDGSAHRSSVTLKGASATMQGRISLQHTQYLSQFAALDASAFYSKQRGAFTNITQNSRHDNVWNAGGRLRLAWCPNERIKGDFSLRFQATDGGAYPYAIDGCNNFETRNNRDNTYKRNFFIASAKFTSDLGFGIFSSATSYQNMHDRMLMDQDFTAADMMTLMQHQVSNAFSEEMVLKSKPGSRWQWTNGIFLSHQNLTTDAPVTFFKDGIDILSGRIGGFITSGMPASMNPQFALTCNDWLTDSRFDTPTLQFALFHQSSVRIGSRVTITAGLRFALENQGISYFAKADELSYVMSMKVSPMAPEMKIPGKIIDFTYQGSDCHNTHQWLPKASISVRIDEVGSNIYGSVAKGYRSGGYNFQSMSDIVQNDYRRLATKYGKQFATLTEEQFAAEQAENRLNLLNSISYKPEYSWNYEVGTHLNFFNNNLRIAAAAFYSRIYDQQIARFAGNTGYGRSMVNAGESESYGGELDFDAYFLNRELIVSGTYGFAHSTFREYSDVVKGKEIDYNGNFVPFAPQHTFSLNIDHTKPLNSRRFRRCFMGVGVNGAGRIYWNESNDYSQSFYATLTAHAGLDWRIAGCDITTELWGKNLTNTRFSTFAFESVATSTALRFTQRALPWQLGLDIKLSF